MGGLLWSVASLVIGALLGVVATSLAQDRVDALLSGLKTRALIVGQDLRGDWQFSYTVSEPDGPRVERTLMRLRQVGTRVRGECEPTTPGGYYYSVRGSISHGVMVGSWSEPDARSRMVGVFQCRIAAGGESLDGSWLGPDIDERPRVGQFTLTRELVSGARG